MSAQTIDGAASKSLSSQYSSLGLVSTGAAGWQTVMSSNSGDFVTPVSFSNTITFATGHSVVGGPLVLPMGRLTITSDTPALSSDTTAQTTVYYSPYLGNRISIPTASGWSSGTFTELSQTLADATKSPAAAGVSSVYDLFVWSDSGTIRCTRGPAWSTTTSRGTGAGTTELQRVNGVYVNKVAITNGPGANLGIYVGTIGTSSSGANGQLNVMFAPAAAAGGTANRVDIWNAYNRIQFRSIVRDSTDTWAYTTATWRSANNSTSNRVTIVRGLDEGAIEASACGLASNSTGAVVRSGIGIDSTSAVSHFPGSLRISNAAFGNMIGPARYGGLPGIGSHFVQWLEHSDAAGTTNWYGDNGTTTDQAGLIVSGYY